MTKTLTEKWKDGELKDGWYYVTSKQFGMLIDRFRDQINDCGDEWRGFDNCQGIADEILAHVPSYDEWQAELASNDKLLNVQKRLEKKIKLLEEQLNCALETMGQVAKLSDNTVDAVQCAHAICLINERLKEMEGTK